MTRYVIIGAGAIGGGIGGRLAQHGHDVVLVARGAHLEALRGNGLRLRSPHDELTIPVTAASDPDDVTLRADDVLVLTTKTHQAAEALAAWADVPVEGGGTAGERLPVLTALNGVASERIALRYFDRVFGVCVWMPSAHLEPGEVIIRTVPISGFFHIGRVPATAAGTDDTELLRQIQADWEDSEFRVLLPDDVMPWKYRKLISNIGNAFQALIGENGSYDDLVAAASAEARQVFDRAGIAYTDDETEAATRAGSFEVKPVPGAPTLGGSTWQSFTRGTGNIETDYLNGEIALIARSHGGTAPINAAIASLARVSAAAGLKPGDLSADDVRQRLGL